MENLRGAAGEFVNNRIFNLAHLSRLLQVFYFSNLEIIRFICAIVKVY